jgi:hypothetical protein
VALGYGTPWALLLDECDGPLELSVLGPMQGLVTAALIRPSGKQKSRVLAVKKHMHEGGLRSAAAPFSTCNGKMTAQPALACQARADPKKHRLRTAQWAPGCARRS